MRAEKNSMIAEIERRLSASGCVLLIDYTAQNTERVAELRRKLRGVGSEMHVVANRMLGLSTKKMGWEGPAERIRKPTAMITGNDEISMAKIVQEFAVLDEKPIGVTGGFLEGKFISRDEVAAIARLPSREVLLGRLVGTICAPMRNIVGVLNQKLSSIVFVLKAAEQKKA